MGIEKEASTPLQSLERVATVRRTAAGGQHSAEGSGR